MIRLNNWHGMRRRCAASFFGIFWALLVSTGGVRAADTKVFAAASLVDVLTIVATAFEKETARRVVVVPGASSTLAQQIMAGAPADIFISADRYHADLVAKPIDEQAYDLFGNRLVVIAAPDLSAESPAEIGLQNLGDLLGTRRLAVADPAHVPAGIYARQALENAGVWAALEDRLAPAADVRAALAFVLEGATPFGIVYRTDALAAQRDIVVEIDPDLHDAIRYWGVLIEKDNVTAELFLSFIGSFEGQNLIDYEGFQTVITPRD